MLLRRTMTMDATTMQQRLSRTTSLPPSASGGVDNLDDITELSQSSVPRNQTPVESSAGENEEVKNLREELGEMKEKLIEITTVHEKYYAVPDGDGRVLPGRLLAVWLIWLIIKNYSVWVQ